MRSWTVVELIPGLSLFVEASDGALVRSSFSTSPGAIPQPFEGIPRNDDEPVLREAARQLQEYAAGQRREFDLPMTPKGTPFQHAVWRELRKIPFGVTRTYRDVAISIGKPAAVRAVGHANGQNPLGLLVPCHRVIGSDGSMTGFSAGVEFKRKLLVHEGVLLPLR